MLQARGLSAGVIAITVTVFIANLGNTIVAPIMPAIKGKFALLMVFVPRRTSPENATQIA